LVIHGGAGTIKKENMSDAQEKAYREKLQEALDIGYAILEKGGSAQEAVQKTINVMEDSPLFNAGRGAVLNSLGKQEMDASIMDGKTLNAGAVAGVSHIRNPINAAILVKDSTRHILLSGNGAEEFAKQHQLKMEQESYFLTEKRLQQLHQVQGKEQALVRKKIKNIELIDNHQYGTVGCVAIDKNHNIVAGTSTGGMTNKKFGRIGDSPIIGAGTYANNKTCGISSTGTGEYFMRTLAAHEASNLMQYKEMSLQDALKHVIHVEIDSLGGDGGMIGLDKNGNIAWDFNTEGMYRGYRKSTGESIIEIYQK
jgi:beta-aspartyl-peptidase (threonine type)